jgi:hypothetical protein
MTLEPIRLSDAATVAAVLAALTPAMADAELGPTLTRAFSGIFFRDRGDRRPLLARHEDGHRWRRGRGSATTAPGSPEKWPHWAAI